MYGFCPLASGSKGNSLFLGTKKTRILIDAGIRAKSLVEKLAEIGVGMETIEAIFITHEHTDHIQGVEALVERYNIPLFANAETAKAVCRIFKTRLPFKIFSTGEPFEYKDLLVHPFSIPHDTVDPVAFSIEHASLKLGFCTDLGHVTPTVKKKLSLCDYLYLESNHEPSMVHACSRPAVYKQRVLSHQGHLSNEQCAELLASLLHRGLKHVHLAHLSSECNAEPTALSRARALLDEAKSSALLSIAYQEKISNSILFDSCV